MFRHTPIRVFGPRCQEPGHLSGSSRGKAMLLPNPTIARRASTRTQSSSNHSFCFLLFISKFPFTPHSCTFSLNPLIDPRPCLPRTKSTVITSTRNSLFTLVVVGIGWTRKREIQRPMSGVVVLPVACLLIASRLGRFSALLILSIVSPSCSGASARSCCYFYRGIQGRPSNYRPVVYCRVEVEELEVGMWGRRPGIA